MVSSLRFCRPPIPLRQCIRLAVHKRLTQEDCFRSASRSFRTNGSTAIFEYSCNVDAESIFRYTAGGYHPLHLGDVLADRYKILHKLGFGGYATIWAARDQRQDRFVAIKIATDDAGQGRESHILKAISTLSKNQSGVSHLPCLLDSFNINGPNGKHQCFVMNIVGKNIGDLMWDKFDDYRLPAKLARRFAREALLALECLHANGIAHGDVHVRNLTLALPDLVDTSEEEFMSKLEQIETGAVIRKDGQPLPPSVPRYLVWPTRYRINIDQTSAHVKFIDFGEAFYRDKPPRLIHTPLAVRPPEAIFEDRLGLEVDVWSMGCMIFELITGQPPFDSILATKQSVVRQMLELTGGDLPERWRSAWKTLLAEERQPSSSESTDTTLQSWLEEVYFDEDKKAELDRSDLVLAGNLIKSMCTVEPRDRITIIEALKSPWLQEQPD